MFHKNTRHYLFVACTLLINTYIIGTDTFNSKNGEEKFVITTTEAEDFEGPHNTLNGYRLNSVGVPTVQYSSSNPGGPNYAPKIKIWTTHVVKVHSYSGTEYSGNIKITFIPPQPFPKETSIDSRHSEELFNAMKDYHNAKRTCADYQRMGLSTKRPTEELEVAVRKYCFLQLELIKTLP